jgi:hypothetical protein
MRIVQLLDDSTGGAFAGIDNNSELRFRTHHPTQKSTFTTNPTSLAFVVCEIIRLTVTCQAQFRRFRKILVTDWPGGLEISPNRSKLLYSPDRAWPAGKPGVARPQKHFDSAQI